VEEGGMRKRQAKKIFKRRLKAIEDHFDRLAAINPRANLWYEMVWAQTMYGEVFTSIDMSGDSPTLMVFASKEEAEKHSGKRFYPVVE
jgi:hypothetical protein